MCDCLGTTLGLIFLVAWSIFGGVFRGVQFAEGRTTLNAIRQDWNISTGQLVLVCIAFGPFYWLIWKPISFTGQRLWSLLGEIG